MTTRGARDDPWVLFAGNPAIVRLASLRPVALRLRLSTNLPFFSGIEYALIFFVFASTQFVSLQIISF